jgi:hypothetical protein
MTSSSRRRRSAPARPRISATNRRNAAGSHLAVAWRALGQVAQAALGGDRLRLDVVAAHGCAPAAGREKARDHLHRRGLAGAVGPEEAEHLAGADAEADLVDGHEAAEALVQTVCTDHRQDFRGAVAGVARTARRGGVAGRCFTMRAKKFNASASRRFAPPGGLGYRLDHGLREGVS